jgi:hypothetical protein
MPPAADSSTSPVKSTPRAEAVDEAVTALGRLTSTASGRAPVAYCMLEAKDKPGLFYAVELKDVRYKHVKILEPGGSPERRNGCMARLEHALIDRAILNRDGGWLTNFMRRGRR